MSETLTKFVTAMDALKSEAEELQDENDRLQTIKATIRVNAHHHGASEEQIDRLVAGSENFITWMEATIQGRYSAAQAEIARLTAALAQSRAETQAALAGCVPQCCMCGKTGLSTAEDGGPECELSDGRWVCSSDCYERSIQPDTSKGKVK